MEKQGTHKSLTSQSEINTKRYVIIKSSPLTIVVYDRRLKPLRQPEYGHMLTLNLLQIFEQMRKLDGSGPPRSYQPQVVPRLSAGMFISSLPIHAEKVTNHMKSQVIRELK